MIDRPALIAEITKIGEDLTGRAIVNGKNFSFRYTKTGDRVFFHFLGRGKRRWNKIEKIEINSDHSSVTCPYFASCGGCSGQHIPYPEQFDLQTKRFVRLYKEIWDLDVKLVPSSQPYRYRNRMDFSIFPSGFGLREAGNFRKIVDIESCLLQSEWADKEWSILRSYLKDNLDIAQDRKSDQGILKYITLRTATGTSETMSIFTFDLGTKGSDQELELEKWLLENSTATHIVFCYNPRQSEVSASGSSRVIRGNIFYTEKVRGKEFQVPFDSFFQPNPKQFEPILESIETWLQESKSTILLDLFSGSGFFSLLFGEGMEKIAGWDVFSPSIETAQSLVKNKFPNAEVQFEAVDLFQRKHLPRFLEAFQKLEINPKDAFLILDPPRNGAGEMVTEWILESGIQKIAYVSCNPSKQWDEIMNKIGKKYSPKEVLITDPYPHTPHMESVVLLERKKDIFF